MHAIYGSDAVYNRRERKQANASFIVTSADIKKAQAKGYDGIIWNFGNRQEFSIWEPVQVKSATDNIGTYDGTNPNIRYKNDRVDENPFQVFDISDWEFDDTTADTIAREYVSHYEDIGEVLKSIADIDITPAKVTAIVDRVLRENIGALDKTTSELWLIL